MTLEERDKWSVPPHSIAQASQFCLSYSPVNSSALVIIIIVINARHGQKAAWRGKALFQLTCYSLL